VTKNEKCFYGISPDFALQVFGEKGGNWYKSLKKDVFLIEKTRFVDWNSFVAVVFKFGNGTPFA
jgi:hypothetical protein